MDELIKVYAKDSKINFSAVKNSCYSHVSTIDKIKEIIRESIKEFHVGIAFQIASNVNCEPNPDNNLEKSLDILKQSALNSNEFYSIYDLSISEHVYVQDRVAEILGIKPEQFKVATFIGANPEVSLFYEHDILHILRFATIVYQVLSIPGLEFKALSDFHQARFRIDVSQSSKKELRELGHIMLEKRTYWVTEKPKNEKYDRINLLYRWSVYHPNQFNGIEHYFVTDLFRSEYMQDFAYLLHAHLLGIPTKFILMLDSRLSNDRNKAIAAEISENIKKYSQISFEIDEGQVADCFSKTIRNKIGEIITIWEHRSRPVTITSDIEAAQEARRMGLVPIPRRVKEFIYRNISEI